MVRETPASETPAPALSLPNAERRPTAASDTDQPEPWGPPGQRQSGGSGASDTPLWMWLVGLLLLPVIAFVILVFIGFQT